jgi:nitronate monooxygenase
VTARPSGGTDNRLDTRLENRTDREGAAVRHPEIIQGGMGVGVSGWRLARAVAASGQLGVVSGTALEVQLARRLQRGDRDGSLRASMIRFPNQALVARVLERYFRPQGLGPGESFLPVPRHTLEASLELVELTVLGAFVEVDLARQGHGGVVGINCLQKIVLPTLPTLYGAMLAGVDYVLIGAGIPLEIPAALDALSRHLPADLAVPIAGDSAHDTVTRFDPAPLRCGSERLRRPFFLPIISSASLAQLLLRRASGAIDGFIVEAPVAGGHNAPPRGAAHFDEIGQPIYGPRDVVDIAALRQLDRPFWLAGGRGRPGCLAEAQRLGAAGIQVGTAFAFCLESGLDPTLRRAALARIESGVGSVLTDPLASPTGFPFKVVDLPGTLSDAGLYAARQRVCNLGFLRSAYRKSDGGVGYRCPAEPEGVFVAKGGTREQTEGRKCLCNSLLANVSLGSESVDTGSELPLLTAGNDLEGVRRLVATRGRSYTARDVLLSLGGPAAG